MCFRDRRMRGSFTVEASVLLPVIIFIMIAMLYYICFLHDCAITESYSIRAAEAALARQEFEGLTGQPAAADQLQDKVIMSSVSGPSVSAAPFSLMAVFRSLKSYRSADAQCSVSMQIPVLQTAAFTGERWEASSRAKALTVDYPADWWKYRIRQKRK